MPTLLKIKALARGLKNGAVLLGKGEWREFIVRLRISLGQIDLKLDASETVTERTHYYADSGGLALDKIMAHFSIGSGDAIVDFGCGKGGVLISLAKYSFVKIVGVEMSPKLVEIAEENIRKLKLNRTEIINCDAADFKALNQFNYFYFFDPFPCVVMKDVIRNIEQSLREKPRKVTIIYLNPFCHSLFVASEVLGKTDEIQHFEHKCFIYSNVK